MNPFPGEGGADLPARIGNYRIETRLGSGGMGIVYRAFDEALQRPLAIKHLLAGTDPVAAARFRREARMAARLNHPAIVHIYEILESEDGDWIVMELVEGETLSRRIRDGRLGLAQAVQLGREIAEGLAEAHAQGVMHRDLKGGNVMITPSGHAKILDFGLAKLISDDADPNLSRTGTILGTFHAMSPEQAQGLELDHRSDLFSLGSLLYEMVTGEAPFLAATASESLARVCGFQQPPACRVRSEVPREISELIDRLLKKEADQRPRSAKEVARSLERLERALPLPDDLSVITERVTERSALSWEDTLAERPAGRVSKYAGRDASTAPLATHMLDPSRSGSERRQITVVCCELAGAGGPSGPALSLDPEILHELLLELRARAAAVAERYDGHLGQLLGNRLLICFGYPQAHEDNASRAVRAALELVDQSAGIKPASGASQRPRTVRLGLRVGIHTGLAVVATAPNRHEPITLGATLDLAAELLSLAEPGSVVVSQATGSLIDKSFVLQALAPVWMPGLGATLVPQRVIEAAAAREDSSAAHLPLVGREREMELLLGRWSLAREGTGQVILISGEAGIGKSRLAQEFRDHLEHLGSGAARWLSCAGSPFARNSPLQPVAGLVRQALALREGDSSPERLQAALQDLSLAEAAPLFAALLDLPAAESPPAPLSPERQREKTLEALVALVLEMAERQAVVLLIEDIHWLDPTTMGWLDRLIDQVPAAPLFVVLTLRLHTMEALWGPRAHLTHITLSPLGDAEARALIGRVVGDKPLPEALRRQIVARTDGVPLFLEELTKAVLESAEAGERKIPATLRDSLAARLSRLGAAREVAQLASVVGRSFSFELLAQISQLDEATLQQELRQLVHAELIYRKGFGARTSYLFKHALLQDAAYESLLKRERQQIHLRIAKALETRFPETAEAHPELLAHHYTEAGVSEPAVEWWHRAGTLASSRSANLEAISHFTHGLQQLEGLEEGPERDRRELAIQSALATASLAGRGLMDPAVEQAYTRAEILAARLEDTQERFWAVLGLHSHVLALGDLGRALELAERLLAVAESSGSPRLLSIAYFWLGAYYHYRGDFATALANLERSYDLAPPDDLTYMARTGLDLRVLALSFGALDLWHAGHPDGARQRGEQAIALARELGSPFTLCIALLLGGGVLGQYRRDAEGSCRSAKEAYDLASELGFPYFLWQTTFLLTWVRLASPAEGRPQADFSGYDSTEKVAQVAGGAMDYYFCVYAEILRLEGRAEEALRAVDEALARLQPQGAPSWTGELFRIRGEILAASSQVAEAERSLETALELVRLSGSRSLELRAALSLGRLWRSQGREAEARALVTGVYQHFTEGFEDQDPREAVHFLGSRPTEETAR